MFNLSIYQSLSILAVRFRFLERKLQIQNLDGKGKANLSNLEGILKKKKKDFRQKKIVIFIEFDKYFYNIPSLLIIFFIIYFLFLYHPNYIINKIKKLAYFVGLIWDSRRFINCSYRFVYTVVFNVAKISTIFLGIHFQNCCKKYFQNFLLYIAVDIVFHDMTQLQPSIFKIDETRKSSQIFQGGKFQKKYYFFSNQETLAEILSTCLFCLVLEGEGVGEKLKHEDLWLSAEFIVCTELCKRDIFLKIFFFLNLFELVHICVLRKLCRSINI
ncbi:hypothetical protein IEQ34_015531 [Dendrobium chrysotoxum]|uniref:Transmembrane protein n=1 Tax=Dendrobium chrysotoxum TaxID=161865 RepID=A0AAV7GI11_DENCH|nr:hypothetical protein IEQ34_015531 [Dendrobium chrysotoxum]